MDGGRWPILALDVTTPKVVRPFHAICCVALEVIRQQGFCYILMDTGQPSVCPGRGRVWLEAC